MGRNLKVAHCILIRGLGCCFSVGGGSSLISGSDARRLSVGEGLLGRLSKRVKCIGKGSRLGRQSLFVGSCLCLGGSEGALLTLKFCLVLAYGAFNYPLKIGEDFLKRGAHFTLGILAQTYCLFSSYVFEL